MNPNEIPPALFKKIPELSKISEALEAYRNNCPITIKCPTCNQTLKVTEIEATGSLWVTCGNGHINYHAKRNKEQNH